MTDSLKSSIEEILHQATGEKVSVELGISISGGCINNAASLKTSLGETLFLKYNTNADPFMFRGEANGLEELSKGKTLRIPRVYGYSDDDSKDTPFILMEYIASGPKDKGFYEAFGRGFAGMHRVTQKQYGFSEDNYIGSTPQINGWMDNWPDFFRERRLGYQIDLARKSGLWDDQMDRWWESLSFRLEEFIGTPYEPPSLLHGDLWSGNYMAGPEGEPCIIDPAVYYGSREADLAMTEVFGSFDSRFYDAYRESYPIEPDYKDRKEIYKLYHLLNHLNLFGRSYEASVRSILKHFGS